MEKIRRHICWLVLLITPLVMSQETAIGTAKKWYIPDYVKVQYAGNIGLFSAGAGYQIFNNVLASEILYGYVPESVSEAKEIHIITLKNTFPLYTWEGKTFNTSAITGFTFSYETGNNSRLKLPDRFPKGYYFTNAFHVTLFAGINMYKELVKSKSLKGIDFYLEFGTVETYLWYAITTREVGITDAFSTAVGINLHL